VIAFHVNLDHPEISLLDKTDKLTLVVNVLRNGDAVLCMWTLLRRLDVISSGECTADDLVDGDALAELSHRENRSLYTAMQNTFYEWENAIGYENDGEGGLATLCEATMIGGLSYNACLDDVVDWIAEQAEYL
jgi:hypothetical protein